MRHRGMLLFVLCGLLAALSACQSNYTLKNPYLPAQNSVDTTGPKYVRNVSQIKDWDRMTTADVATGFSWWDSTGAVVSLNDLWRKVVVLNFFGTWSPPCVDQLKELKALHASLRDTDVVLLGATLKEPYTGGKAVMFVDSFARANNLRYQLLIGSRDFSFTYGGVDIVPTTFVISPKRHVTSTFEGLVTASALRTAIEEAKSK